MSPETIVDRREEKKGPSAWFKFAMPHGGTPTVSTFEEKKTTLLPGPANANEALIQWGKFGTSSD